MRKSAITASVRMKNFATRGTKMSRAYTVIEQRSYNDALNDVYSYLQHMKNSSNVNADHAKGIIEWLYKNPGKKCKSEGVDLWDIINKD